MKIAIFHNFMDNIGGAELVDLILARELNADIYTTNIDEEKIRKLFPFKNFDVADINLNVYFAIATQEQKTTAWFENYWLRIGYLRNHCVYHLVKKAGGGFAVVFR